MRRWWLLLVALLLGPVAWAAPAAPAGSPVAAHGRLAVKGNRVVDAQGRPFAVHGMSLFWSQWQPRYYDPATVAWLVRDWRVTAVRAAIGAQQGGYDTQPEAETKRAEAVIDAAIAQGIYVVVDWHAHQPRADDAVRFFSHIATKYRGVPNLIYETYNEPLPEHGWAKVLKPYHAKVIGAIRAIDPGAFVVAGTRSWSQDVDEAAADPLPFANVAYTLHFYAATHKGELRAKAETAMRRGVALFVTEYGTTAANGDAPIDAKETQTWWDWCAKNGISYLNWSVANKDEASAILKPTTQGLSGWSEADLTESGRLVRGHLRAAR
ncbi:glycoside hydrolase family 5 protein [uncultured Sphingomonas sp.]|uniref:glycoside hydrolase family 5 protein n=1 Tax=uncultured Sphingomonas sp. TaxID=158754 RepID=UPI002587C4F3|nr:glycoside hydrolase family 5 protein [uncultured Sphingomonas sp.]